MAQGRPGRGVLVGVGVATAAVVAGAVVRIRQLFDPHLFPRTQSGPALVFTIEDEDGERVRVLGTSFGRGGALQSATYLGERRWELPFEYYRAFDVALDPDLPASDDGMVDVLMLGGGGYAWPKHALHDFDDVRVDVVERDPAMTEIARKWFFLDELDRSLRLRAEGRLGIFTMDASAYLRGCSKRYAAIINDAFVGNVPVEPLIGPEALANIRRCLLEGGIYVVNVPEREGSDARLRHVVEAVGAAFAHVHVLPCSDPDFSDDDNYLVIGTDDERPFEGALES